jgi:hypothetical protein
VNLLAEMILHEATTRWHLTIKSKDGRLIISPARNCPPEIMELLKLHKHAIIDFLQAQDAKTSADSAPWIHVGRQVIAGEFDDADRSTRMSLLIGLRSVSHPVCRQAFENLTASSDRKEPA